MIVFDKDLASDKQLWVFNNNIVSFHDDGVETPLYCDVSVTGVFTARVYPINGQFEFNFKAYLKAIAVKNRLADVITFNIGADVSTLIYDDTDNVYLDLDVDFNITMSDDSTVSTSKNYKFISGVEQLDDYQRQEYYQINAFLLNRLSSRSKKDYYLNYWEGYPFDISIYSISTGDLNILNETNALHIDVPLAADTVINRIAFCDANSNLTIEDHLPLQKGYNKLKLTRPGYISSPDEAPIELVLKKHEADCGVYVKFRNAAGGWSYWLFHKNQNIERSVKDLKEIYNDYSNIEDTTSPTVQGGKESSSDRVNVIAKGVNYDDIRTLEYLVESPKVYLFTGERFSISPTVDDNQWIEIKCLTKKLLLKRAKRNKFNIPFDFALPQRNIVSLL